MSEAFRNLGLFKDYYLLNRLSDMPEHWRPSESETHQAYDAIARALRGFRSTYRRPNEPQTEQDLVEPVLEALGFVFVPQTDAKRQGQGNVPDYTLFADQQTKEAAARHLGGDNRRFYSPSLAIVEAKRWGRKLDSVDRTDREGVENPSQQIVRYLGAVSPFGVLWGILTDGKRWRLYYQLAEDRTAQFYEVDLEDLCKGDYEADRPPFRYFFYLFRAAAFATDPRTGQRLLDWLREQSQIHSQKVEADLKARVFDRIVPYLARGFIYHRRREQAISGPEIPEELAAVFGGTLALLYRLLFLLYAEDRDLLPVADRGGYRENSLTKLKVEIAGPAQHMVDEPTGVDSYQLWARLQALFRAVQWGSTPWNVPRYNGRLFSDEGASNEFLSAHKVPDDYLTMALYHLCRDEDDPDGFIDYKDLEVRQLGSVYEGLLEFHLAWADRDLVVLKDGDRYYYEDAERVTPHARGRGRHTYGSVARGELYLVNDRKERRATGAVFTPEYIVSHIVKKTVGPALQERLDSAAEALARRQSGVQTAVLDAVFGLRILDPAMGSGHFLVRTLDFLSDRLAEWLASQPADNPVTATLDGIRGAILASLGEQGMSSEFVAAASEKLTDNNLLKRLLMKKCLYGVDYNPMAVELAKLSLWLDAFTLGAPLSFLDHHLRCGNSLVGGDWATIMEDFSAEQRGRGKRRSTQRTLDGQFFGPVLEAARHMDELASLTDASLPEVERSAGLFEQYYREVAPYRTMLDLWVSRCFDRNLPGDEFRVWGPAYAVYLTEGEAAYEATRGGAKGDSDRAEGRTEAKTRGLRKAGPAPEAVRRHVRRATELAREPWKRFFHWELEFPEVYFRNKQRVPDAGFNVVLGNPPYIKYQTRDDTDEFKRWYRERFQSAHGNYDVYVLFVEQALRLLRPGGRHGYIVYNKWLMSEYGRKLRGLLAEARLAREVVDLGDNQLFPGLTTYTCLLFAEMRKHEALRYTLVPLLGNEGAVQDLLPRVLDAVEHGWAAAHAGPAATSSLANALESFRLDRPVQTDDFDQAEFTEEPWEFAFGPSRPLRAKVRKAGQPLLPLTRDGDGIFVGIQTSADHVFIMSFARELPNGGLRLRSGALGRTVDIEPQLLRPLVSGEHVDRYVLLPTTRRVLFPYLVDGEEAKLVDSHKMLRYPKAWRYLCRFEGVLRGREADEDDRPFDDDQWYRFGRHQNIGKQHLRKLCVAETVTKLEVAFDPGGDFCAHNVRVNSIALSDSASVSDYLYLLAVLNSRLLDWFFKTSPTGRHAQGHYAANRQFIKDLPIYMPSDATQGKRRAQLLRKLKERHAQCETDADLAGLHTRCDSDFLVGQGRADDVARDVLVWLARRVTKGMQARQEERAGFLHWLSGQLGTDWEDLSGSTNLARYDQREFDEVWDALSQPANVATYKATAQRGFRGRSRRLREAVEREYEKSVGKLRRRQATLDRDQRLIDHIVYRLYGLTDEEIAVVESGP
jgi:hypothetical protein